MVFTMSATADIVSCEPSALCLTGRSLEAKQTTYGGWDSRPLGRDQQNGAPANPQLSHPCAGRGGSLVAVVIGASSVAANLRDGIAVHVELVVLTITALSYSEC